MKLGELTPDQEQRIRSYLAKKDAEKQKPEGKMPYNPEQDDPYPEEDDLDIPSIENGQKVRNPNPLPKARARLTPEQVQEANIVGKYFLRDLPLFKYEILFYIITLMAIVMALITERLGIATGILSTTILLAVALPIAIWVIKRMFYMPSKYKVPGIRVYKSGVIELTLENIKKGFIQYGRGDQAQKKYITRLNKHNEASTGRPFVVTSEVRGENIDLVNENKPDMRSEEFNAILETNTAVTTKNVMNKMLKFAQPGLTNPMMILIIINIFISIVLVIREFGIMEMI